MIPRKNKSVVPIARMMRKAMTPHERKLWFLFLQKHPVRFYRQRVIDSFIADFYCASAKIVIEIDGAQHNTPQGLQYDRERTAIIESYGVQILRFSNSDIDFHFNDVCKTIDAAVAQRQQKFTENP
ncbi:MAG: endonuclease domain-containing protein [Clostridia bacterium]|nr:endonuclease domain-containing protein [Clostridia bacterium]